VRHDVRRRGTTHTHDCLRSVRRRRRRAHRGHISAVTCTNIDLRDKRRERGGGLRARQRCTQRAVRIDTECAQRREQRRVSRLRALVVDTEQRALQRDCDARICIAAETGK
jgi:hypothetical protein